MKPIIFAIFMLFAIAINAADFHHVHIRAQDTLLSATWYAENMSGEQLRIANFHGVRFGRKLMLFAPKQRPGPDGSDAPSMLKSSSGTSVDHLGFSFKEFESKLISLQLAGAKVTRAPKTFDYDRSFLQAFIEDPWGQKIALLSDPKIEGLHHVHIVSTEPVKAVRWFSNSFGGLVESFNGNKELPAIRYADFWLVASKSEAEPDPNMFSMIDHLGFHVSDVDKKMLGLKNVKVLKPAHGFYWWQAIPGMPGPKNGFVESPSKILIEVMQLK